MKSARRLPVVLLASMALIGAGCGTGGDRKADDSGRAPVESTALPSAAEVCKLVSKKEVEEVVGGRFSRGEDPSASGVGGAINVVGMRFCRFRSETKPPEPGGTVSVGLAVAYGPEVFDKYKETSNAGPAAESKVGDQAVWSEATGSLVALQDNKVVGVSVFLNDPRATNQKAIAESLAGKALRRL